MRHHPLEQVLGQPLVVVKAERGRIERAVVEADEGGHRGIHLVEHAAAPHPHAMLPVEDVAGVVAMGLHGLVVAARAEALEHRRQPVREARQPPADVIGPVHGSRRIVGHALAGRIVEAPHDLAAIAADERDAGRRRIAARHSLGQPRGTPVAAAVDQSRLRYAAGFDLRRVEALMRDPQEIHQPRHDLALAPVEVAAAPGHPGKARAMRAEGGDEGLAVHAAGDPEQRRVAAGHEGDEVPEIDVAGGQEPVEAGSLPCEDRPVSFRGSGR